jgi:hypothetical protein
MKKDFWIGGLMDEWIEAHGWMRSMSPNNPFILSIYEQSAA